MKVLAIIKVIVCVCAVIFFFSQAGKARKGNNTAINLWVFLLKPDPSRYIPERVSLCNVALNLGLAIGASCLTATLFKSSQVLSILALVFIVLPILACVILSHTPALRK